MTKCPFGVQLLVRPSGVQFSSLDAPELGSGTHSSSGSNQMNSSFSSSKLLNELGSESRLRSKEGGGDDAGGGPSTRHIRDLDVLEFKSWWSETVQGMEKGNTRRYMDCLFSCKCAPLNKWRRLETSLMG